MKNWTIKPEEIDGLTPDVAAKKEARLIDRHDFHIRSARALHDAGNYRVSQIHVRKAKKLAARFN